MNRLTPVSTLLAALVVGLMSARTADAAPTTKRACFEASQSGQLLERSGKLHDAQAQFLVCASSACPEVVATDCTQHIESIRQAQPSLVFEVKDPSGADLTAVRVLIDGALLAEHLDGRPLEMDPGPHTFRLEVAGQEAVERPLLIRAGDKARHEAVVIGHAASAPVVAVVPPPADSHASSHAGLRVASYVAGGFGVVGLGVGIGVGAAASSEWSRAKSECGSGCSSTSPAQSTKATASGEALGSTVGFVAGGAALATGVVLFLLSRGHTEPSQGTAIRVMPNVSASGPGMLVMGRF